MSVWFYIAVIAAGIIGSMGMGGGTILIPALVFLGEFSQHVSQTYNLIAFVPIALFSLTVYTKGKLVKFRIALFCALFAASTAALTSFFAQKVEGAILAKILGGFLITLAVVQVVIVFRKKPIKRKR